MWNVLLIVQMILHFVMREAANSDRSIFVCIYKTTVSKKNVEFLAFPQTQRSAHATCRRVSNKKVCRRPRVRQPVIKDPAPSVTYNTGSRWWSIKKFVRINYAGISFVQRACHMDSTNFFVRNKLRVNLNGIYLNVAFIMLVIMTENECSIG